MTGDGRKIAPSLLDPADWSAFRSAAHALLDRLILRLEQAGEGPVWTPMPETVKRRLAQSPPLEPRDVDEVCEDLAALILPYGTGNTHPRFWGWVHGSGTAGGMLAEMAAGAMNANCGGRDHGAIHVERCVLDWMTQWFGFPQSTAGGLLVSGSSMANLLGLAAARNRAAANVRRDGLKDMRLTGYVSREAHSCIAKAFELLGLGRDALRHIRVGDDFAMDVDWLRAEVKQDRADGFAPFCVIATAGTVNTGASDDIAALADFCRSENLWLHVDGAFGALTVLCPELAPRLAGIEAADSLAFDFHKWLHVPYDAGCLLVRNQTALLDTFADRAPYLASEAALAGGDIWPCDLGPELSRSFRALKVWFTLQEHGTRKLGEAIARNCRQARVLAAKLADRPAIRLMAPVPLQIVCCRYQAESLDETATDALNAALVATLQRRGIAAPSTCRIHGRLCIRVNITNHRTSNTDLTLLVEAVDSIGAELAETAQAQQQRAAS